MDKDQAQVVIDRLIDDSACILSRERWSELMESVEALMPESRFASSEDSE